MSIRPLDPQTQRSLDHPSANFGASESSTASADHHVDRIRKGERRTEPDRDHADKRAAERGGPKQTARHGLIVERREHLRAEARPVNVGQAGQAQAGSQPGQGLSHDLVRADWIGNAGEVPVRLESDWTDGSTLNDRGRPVGNLCNALYTFRHAPELRGVPVYDEFRSEVIVNKAPPWGGEPARRWTERDDICAREWFQRHDIAVAAGDVRHAVRTVAQENPDHPVRRYLTSMVWDGKPRLDRWLFDYLGAEDTPYVLAVGPRFLISAVARILKPGCKVDHMLILEGPQGAEKSSALQALGEPWFTDQLSRLGTKDSSMEVIGTWLIEIAELDAMTRAGNSAIKAFVSRQADRFRPPYGRQVYHYPRQCVFCGTINPDGNGYLKDPTGARRFWPVECGIINLNSLRRDRDQLWAEAVVRYEKGQKWWLETPELEALATQEQKKRFPSDPWAGPVGRWLVGRNDVSVTQVLTEALNLAPQNHSQAAQNRVRQNPHK